MTLGYRYCIKPKLLKTLEETTADLSHMGVNAGKRGNYHTHHYTVWHNYSMEPYESTDYRKKLPELKKWCDKNEKHFEYLSDGLRMISLMTYMRYRGARSYLQAHHNLQLLCVFGLG